MHTAFKINNRDNVATALVDCPVGAKILLRGVAEQQQVMSIEEIKAQHKVALCDIEAGEAVVKYGKAIGYAANAISKGDWVHLHNCASNYDERSNTLDGHSGAPTDTQYV
ncbi:MAG: UxaA family hydrolase [Verrucomicrobiota bacterium]